MRIHEMGLMNYSLIIHRVWIFISVIYRFLLPRKGSYTISL